MKRTLFVEKESTSGVMSEVIQDPHGVGWFYPIVLKVERLNPLSAGVTTRTELSMLC
jgi:hypothetical protein